jgi:hypothetical protein
MGSGSTAGDVHHVAGRDLLPEPVSGSLPGALIAEAARREGDEAAELPDEVAYHAYEAGDQRFAWVGTPVSVEGEGFQFFFVHLRRAGDGGAWEFVDIDPHDSPEDAMMAAGREWLMATGGPDVPTEPVADW